MLTGFLDAIDGAVAKLRGQASKRGAFLDSLIDRLCEMVYALALLKLGLDVYVVLIYLGFSMIISYERARGESLGVPMSGVGLMERSERLLGLMLVTTLLLFDPSVANAALIILVSLTAFTVVERAVYVWRNLELRRN
jgi:archaetidylinositol phosphate synthase